MRPAESVWECPSNPIRYLKKQKFKKKKVSFKNIQEKTLMKTRTVHTRFNTAQGKEAAATAPSGTTAAAVAAFVAATRPEGARAPARGAGALTAGLARAAAGPCIFNHAHLSNGQAASFDTPTSVLSAQSTRFSKPELFISDQLVAWFVLERPCLY